MAASVVRVWEPGGKLEWLLLCDDAVSSFPQARERARQYASRWLIEDFHKALKTGLGAERLQLHTASRLFAAVALLSVVALALVDLREHSHQQPDASDEMGVYRLAIYRYCGASALSPFGTCGTYSTP